jgi:hypothetical protein
MAALMPTYQYVQIVAKLGPLWRQTKGGTVEALLTKVVNR